MLSPSEGRSPTKSPAIQKRLLLRRRGRAKYGGPLRAAAQARNAVGVKAGVFEGAPVSRGPAQVAAAFLARERLRVHIREIEEWPLRLGGLPVETAVDGAAGRGAGKRIGGERSGAAAEHVARKLVEHDDVGQRSGGIVHPGAERSGKCCRVEAKELGANFGIHGGVSHEPSLRTEGAPIGEHVGSRRQR